MNNIVNSAIFFYFIARTKNIMAFLDRLGLHKVIIDLVASFNVFLRETTHSGFLGEGAHRVSKFFDRIGGRRIISWRQTFILALISFGITGAIIIIAELLLLEVHKGHYEIDEFLRVLVEYLIPHIITYAVLNLVFGFISLSITRLFLTRMSNSLYTGGLLKYVLLDLAITFLCFYGVLLSGELVFILQSVIKGLPVIAYGSNHYFLVDFFSLKISRHTQLLIFRHETLYLFPIATILPSLLHLTLFLGTKFFKPLIQYLIPNTHNQRQREELSKQSPRVNARFRFKPKRKHKTATRYKKMLSWTRKNKEWIFSGLGVAVISGLVSFLVSSINNTKTTLSPLEISSSNVIYPGGKEATWITHIVNYSSTLSRETTLEFTFEVPLERVHVSKYLSRDTGLVHLSKNAANIIGKEITVLIPSIQPGEYVEIEVDGFFKEMLRGRANAILMLKDEKGKVLHRASSKITMDPGYWMGPHDPRIYERHMPVKKPKL